MRRMERRVIIVLSADQDCVQRVQRVVQDQHKQLEWLATDPETFLRALNPELVSSLEPDLPHIEGIILDLSSPEPLPFHLFQPPAELEIARHIADCLALLQTIRCSPIAVISADLRVQEIFHRAGLLVTAQVAPNADETCLSYALQRLAMPRSLSGTSRPSRRNGVPVSHSAAAIPLQSHLWIDPQSCALIRNGRTIALTAREFQVLGLLLRTPNCYHSARDLAHRLTKAGAYPIGQHSVAQTISILRNKLGERAHGQRLLLTRRGIGYGLFLQAEEKGRAQNLLDLAPSRQREVNLNFC